MAAILDFFHFFFLNLLVRFFFCYTHFLNLQKKFKLKKNFKLYFYEAYFDSYSG